MPKIYTTPPQGRRPWLIALGFVVLALAVVAFLLIEPLSLGSGGVAALIFGGAVGVFAGIILLVLGLRKGRIDVENAFAIDENGELYHLYAEVGGPEKSPGALLGRRKYSEEMGEMLKVWTKAEQQLQGEAFPEYVQQVIENPFHFNEIFRVVHMENPEIIHKARSFDVIWYTAGEARQVCQAILDRRNAGHQLIVQRIEKQWPMPNYEGYEVGDHLEK